MSDTDLRMGQRGSGLPTFVGWKLDCLALLVLAAVFRFTWLSRTSLWADEIFSVNWSKLDLYYILGEGSRLETNPPLFYVLLKGWMEVFGSSAFAVRALPALAATLAVLVVYAIGRRLQGRALGLIAGLFIVLDPDIISLARQARGYAFLALFASLALLGLTEALRSTGQKRVAALALFTLSSIFSFLFHYTALFFIAACFAAVILSLLFGPEPASRRTWLSWAAVAAIIGLAIIGPLQTAVTMSHSSNLDWIDPLSLTVLWEYFAKLYIGRARPGLFATPVCVILIVGSVAGLWLRRPTGVRLQIMVVVPVVFLGILLGVSLFRPLFIARTGAWLTAPISLLLGWFVLAPASKFTRIALFTGITLILGSLSFKVLTRPPIEDWIGTTRLVLTNPKCNGPLMLIGPHVFDATYYEPRLADRPIYWVRLYRDQIETAEGALNRRLTNATAINPEDVGPFLNAHPGTAVVYRNGVDKFAAAALSGSIDAMSVSQEEDGIHVLCR